MVIPCPRRDHGRRPAAASAIAASGTRIEPVGV